MSEVLRTDEYGRVLAALQAHIRRHPQKVATIESKLGCSRSYLHRQLRGDVSMTVDKLLALLRVVDLDPGELMMRATHVGAEGLLEGLVPEESRKPSSIIALRRAARSLIENDEAGNPSAATSAAIESLPAVSKQRYSDPWQAARHAFSVAVHVAPQLGAGRVELFCRAVGSYAASCRLGGAPEHACRALLVALPLAGRGRPLLRAWLLEKVSYSLISAGDYENAISVIGDAESLLNKGYEPDLMGRLFVGRGLALQFSGQLEMASSQFRCALQLLGNEQPRFVGSAHNGLARVHLERGQLGRAVRELETARSFLDEEDKYSLGHLAWTWARWAEKCGEDTLARETYADAVDRLSSINPFDTALALLDWIEFQLQDGDLANAVISAERMLRLLEPLKTNRIASRIVLQLRQAAATGRLSLKLVRTAYQKLAGERKRGIRPPRSIYASRRA